MTASQIVLSAWGAMTVLGLAVVFWGIATAKEDDDDA